MPRCSFVIVLTVRNKGNYFRVSRHSYHPDIFLKVNVKVSAQQYVIGNIILLYFFCIISRASSSFIASGSQDNTIKIWNVPTTMDNVRKKHISLPLLTTGSYFSMFHRVMIHAGSLERVALLKTQPKTT